jgi:hypothetical protein
MKLPARIAMWPAAARIAACLLPLALTTGCFHRSHPAQTPPLAPPVQTPQPSTPALEPSAPLVSVPAITAPEKPAETPAASATSTPPASQPKPPVHHTPKKPANPHPQVASNGAASVSAIGQLSSGDPGDYRRQTENSIASTERGLKCITRPLNDQEQRTAAHIREFLKQARQALASGDVDGAHTLAAKAKVLLNELNH